MRFQRLVAKDSKPFLDTLPDWLGTTYRKAVRPDAARTGKDNRHRGSGHHGI